MAGTSKKTRVVTFRMRHDTYEKLKKNHPNVSEYLRDRIEYDITRRHERKKKVK